MLKLLCWDQLPDLRLHIVKPVGVYALIAYALLHKVYTNVCIHPAAVFASGVNAYLPSSALLATGK